MKLIIEQRIEAVQAIAQRLSIQTENLYEKVKSELFKQTPVHLESEKEQHTDNAPNSVEVITLVSLGVFATGFFGWLASGELWAKALTVIGGVSTIGGASTLYYVAKKDNKRQDDNDNKNANTLVKQRNRLQADETDRISSLVIDAIKQYGHSWDDFAESSNEILITQLKKCELTGNQRFKAESFLLVPKKMEFSFIAYRNMLENATDKESFLEELSKIIKIVKRQIETVSTEQMESYKKVLRVVSEQR